MKKNKGKYVRLTEDELKKLINEEVNKQLTLIVEKENIDVKSEEYNKCINDCFNSINTIIDILSRGDVYEIGEYINSI